MQNACNEERPHEEVVVEVMNIENIYTGLHHQGLTDNEIRLMEEVTEQMKTEEAPSNLSNFERK